MSRIYLQSGETWVRINKFSTNLQSGITHYRNYRAIFGGFLYVTEFIEVVVTWAFFFIFRLFFNIVWVNANILLK